MIFGKGKKKKDIEKEGEKREGGKEREGIERKREGDMFGKRKNNVDRVLELESIESQQKE